MTARKQAGDDINDEEMDDEEFLAYRKKLVLDRARGAGLLAPPKSARISGKVSSKLLAQAKQMSRLTSNTELIEFALCRLVVENNDFERWLARLDG